MFPNIFQNMFHGEEKHGEEFVEVQRELRKNSAEEIMFNSSTNRYAEIVRLSDGRYGVRICQKISASIFDEVTCFKKNKMKKISQVIKYLSNQGYELLQ